MVEAFSSKQAVTQEYKRGCYRLFKIKMVTFRELLARWEPYRGLTAPLRQRIALWSGGGCGIWISDEWGPAVPYGPVDHGDGTRNHGYVRLKDDLTLIGQVPEVDGWPELHRFLEVLNAPLSPVESVGCEKCYASSEEQGAPPVLLGSYVDVVFTKTALNDESENLLLPASHLARAVENCETWWASISFVLQRNRLLAGTTMPWGLMLHVQNYGRSEEEARKFWSTSLSRLSKAIEELPQDFKFTGEQ
jgi:hypothetical protein